MGGLSMWMQYATKVCARCKIEKDIDLFGKDEKAKDGYQSYCKPCQKEVYTKWREEHRPRSRKLALEHYRRHKEEKMEYQRKYRDNRQRLRVHSLRTHHPEIQPLDKQCMFCEQKEGLIRHHPSYDTPEVYVTCCRQCHWWVHNG